MHLCNAFTIATIMCCVRFGSRTHLSVPQLVCLSGCGFHAMLTKMWRIKNSSFQFKYHGLNAFSYTFPTATCTLCMHLFHPSAGRQRMNRTGGYDENDLALQNYTKLTKTWNLFSHINDSIDGLEPNAEQKQKQKQNIVHNGKIQMQVENENENDRVGEKNMNISCERKRI